MPKTKLNVDARRALTFLYDYHATNPELRAIRAQVCRAGHPLTIEQVVRVLQLAGHRAPQPPSGERLYGAPAGKQGWPPEDECAERRFAEPFVYPDSEPLAIAA